MIPSEKPAAFRFCTRVSRDVARTSPRWRPSAELGSARPRLSSGRRRDGSTCRLGARPVRRYISRRREETTADLRRTVVALSPPGAALGHFRTRAKNPPNVRGVASPSLGTVVPIGRRLRRRHRRRWSSTTIVHVTLERRVRLRGRDVTRRDATPGTRSDFVAESKLRYRLCRPAVALDFTLRAGARGRRGVE